MKKTTLILMFALTAIFAWGGNNTEYPQKAKTNVTAKSGKTVKQKSEAGQAERREVLKRIYYMGKYCDYLTNEIKKLEKADSLKNYVWEHRDNLEKASEDTLTLFLNNLSSWTLICPDDEKPQTDGWYEIAPKEVVNYIESFYSIKQGASGLLAQYYEKKQRVIDVINSEIFYAKVKPETYPEMVRIMLDSPETRSLFGRYEQLLVNLKLLKSSLKSMNSSCRKSMQVTDKELSEMFENGIDDFNLKIKTTF